MITIDINYDAGKFEESKHPRAKGGQHGGQFAKKGTGVSAGASADLWHKASSQERAAVKAFTHSSLDINTYLWNPEKHSINAAQKKTVAHLDRLFAKPDAKLKQAITLSRGDPISGKLIEKWQKDLAGGKRVTTTHKGFMSTSKISGQMWPGVHLEITAKEGTPALDLAGVTEDPNEQEVLLNRGQRFHVQAIEYNPGYSSADLVGAGRGTRGWRSAIKSIKLVTI
jgi:hypothetical protein